MQRIITLVSIPWVPNKNDGINSYHLLSIHLEPGTGLRALHTLAAILPGSSNKD